MHIVILSGAGISAESGLRTFRDSGGLWEGYRIDQVATPDAWTRDPDLVLRFYNERREAMYAAEPNAAHRALAQLEARHRVTIVTQNVDNLHERSGSSKVLHLHGELDFARSTGDPDYIVPLGGKPIRIGDRCPKGYQLRPHIVWFGEAVPLIEAAFEIVQTADHFLVVGTSLAVYPAAGLLDGVRPGVPITTIDPSDSPAFKRGRHLKMTAVVGVASVVRELSGTGR